MVSLLDFLITKAKFMSKKLVLNEYEIGLKMLEMAILEIQIFKNFWGSMPPHPPGKFVPSALVGDPPFESPGSVPGFSVEILKWHSRGLLLLCLGVPKEPKVDLTW